MSSYLVALIISDFDCISRTVLNSGEYGTVEVRVCGRRAAILSGQLNYALEIATNLIEFYEKFYNVKYPLPKSGE